MRTTIRLLLFSIILISFFGCEKENINILNVSKDNFVFPEAGGQFNVEIKTDADAWKIDNPAQEWLTLSSTSGTQKEVTVSVTVDSKTLTPRTDTLTITAGNAVPVQVIVTQLSSEYLYAISPNINSISFIQNGNTDSIKINTDAPAWRLENDADWLQFSDTAGGNGSSSILITALENKGSDERTATVLVHAEKAKSIEISIVQKGSLYPSYNISPLSPDATGMSSSATELAEKIKLGWNIGNTLEAIGGETAWGNPRVSEEMIQLVKQSGFNAIRIPCSWNQYLESTTRAKIKASWLDRVKQVVQYCVDNDMYVLLNIHWDGGWLENNCTPDKQGANNAKQKAFWEQIATHLREFDERLIFASANEPNVENPTQMAVLQSYHQTFVDAVRSTGGRNSYRVLVVQGPSTDIDKTNTLMNTLPNDEVTNRLMMEIHFYTPWNFCGLEKDASWGNMFYYWGQGNHSAVDTKHNPTWGEESTVDALFAKMKVKFVDKGIPVIMGEYGAVRRSSLTGEALTLHLQSRAYYLRYVTKQAIANGILPFYWDNGGTGNNGMALFNRYTQTIFDQQALDALMEGANE